jgi:hypothetical protein
MEQLLSEAVPEAGEAGQEMLLPALGQLEVAEEVRHGLTVWQMEILQILLAVLEYRVEMAEQAAIFILVMMRRVEEEVVVLWAQVEMEPRCIRMRVVLVVLVVPLHFSMELSDRSVVEAVAAQMRPLSHRVAQVGVGQEAHPFLHQVYQPPQILAAAVVAQVVV